MCKFKSRLKERINEEKVFYLSPHKSGTTSMGIFLSRLGYKVQSCYKPDNRLFFSQSKEDIVWELFLNALNFSGFQDDPWFLFYKEFYEIFPNSKYIYYKRDVDSWMESATAHFGLISNASREYIYGKNHGAPRKSKERWREVFEQHSRNIDEFFLGKENRFLKIEGLSNESLTKVQAFLGKEELPFRGCVVANSRNRFRQVGRLSSLLDSNIYYLKKGIKRVCCKILNKTHRV